MVVGNGRMPLKRQTREIDLLVDDDPRTKRRMRRLETKSTPSSTLVVVPEKKRFRRCAYQPPPPPRKKPNRTQPPQPTTHDDDDEDDEDNRPDPDYVRFLNGLGLGFPLSTVDNSDSDGEPNLNDGGSRDRSVVRILEEADNSTDVDVDLSIFMRNHDCADISLDPGTNMPMIENNATDAGLSNGGESGMAKDNADGQTLQGMLLRSCSSTGGGGGDMSADIIHVESEYEELEIDNGKSPDNGAVDGDHVVDDTCFDNVDVPEEATDGCDDLNDVPFDNVQAYDNDPLFSMFLENMTICGSGYMVKLPVGAEEPIILVYEKDDVSHSQHEIENHKTRRESLRRENGESERSAERPCNENRRDCTTADEVDVGCHPRVPDEKMEDSFVAMKSLHKKDKMPCEGSKSEKISRMGKQKEISVAAESSHRAEARSTVGNQQKSRVKNTKNETKVGTENVCRAEKVPIAMTVKQEHVEERTKKVSEPSLVNQRRKETHACSNGKILKTHKDVKGIQDSKRNRPVSEVEERNASKNPTSFEQIATKRPSGNKQKIALEEADKVYGTFLSSLTEKKTGLEFKPAIGETVVYGDYHLISYDSDVEEIDEATFAINTGNLPVPSNRREIIDVDAEPEVPGRNFNSEFRVQLIESLRKPYSQMEHKNLLEQVYRKKHMTKEKQLRGGRSIDVKLDQLAESFVERYPDFGRKLEALKSNIQSNHPVQLNLLRGFMYWLEKSPLPGSFKPWLDESCLKVLPSCKQGDYNA
ncbi:hypothetical protein LINPERPRIM_LOCUS13221 [Linum perenne]